MKLKYCLQTLVAVSALAGVVGAANAVLIDKYFVVNPIRVCDNGGGSCTTANTYAAQTQKIYAQANVAPVFLPTTQINKAMSQFHVEFIIPLA